MIKTIKIDKDTELTLSNNASWLFEYRDQFGHDITPDILPLVNAIVKVIGEIIPYTNGKDDLIELIKAIPSNALTDVVFELAGWQAVDFINLVWAMAKVVDEDIPEPKKWVRNFESFPIDVIAPAVWELVLKGFVTSKNLKALDVKRATKTKKSASKQSPSQGLKEA